MVALPRVLTVDPTGRIARIVRAAIDIADLSVIHIEAPNGNVALEELAFSPVSMVVTAYTLDNNISGIRLAEEIKKASPNTAVVVLTDKEIDPPAQDPNTGYLILQRASDPAQLMRVIFAGVTHRNIFLAAEPPARKISTEIEMGDVPPIDIKFVERIIEKMLEEFRPMAVLLANRLGEMVFERGAIGYIDHEGLTAALVPGVLVNVGMANVLGGQPASLKFYDGDKYDVFTLSVGYHYMLCIIFDGRNGSRHFGAVNRFGRRAAEDLSAMLGISSFRIDPHHHDPDATVRRPTAPPKAEPVAQVAPERAPAWEASPVEAKAAPKAEAKPAPTPKPVEKTVPEPQVLRLEPILDFDMSIFDQNMDSLLGEADDLFDPDKLAAIADEQRRDSGPLNYDEARQLGLIP